MTPYAFRKIRSYRNNVHAFCLPKFMIYYCRQLCFTLQLMCFEMFFNLSYVFRNVFLLASVFLYYKFSYVLNSRNGFDRPLPPKKKSWGSDSSRYPLGSKTLSSFSPSTITSPNSSQNDLHSKIRLYLDLYVD